LQDRYVTISVVDTGIGIEPDDQARIFERFFRAEDSNVQKVAGTGLGLAIVRSLVEMHGGVINVDSERDKGSTFTFSLPIAADTAGE
ncbi:MAG: ATP-binding protein, partial [Candidatus Promineifilaceae bacterium]|nr:ATP-binding protein [Candidatus Promineifilaceae bacterium]